MKTPDYLSYERYKKKKKSKSKNGMLTAVTTFCVALLIFTYVAKSLSPDVDVTIGDQSQTEAKETGLGVKQFIDERLKLIQMDDNSAPSPTEKMNKKTAKKSDEKINPAEQEYEEAIELPTKSVHWNPEDVTEDSIEEEPVHFAHPTRPSLSTRKPPRPHSKKLALTPITKSPRMTKVYVGYYSTVDQARVAQEILTDSGIDISPFVKDMGNFYTLQVGCYGVRNKAIELVAKLKQNNFPARVVQD